MTLAAGASPAQPDSHGCLPIHVAAACGQAAAVRLLLAALPHSATVTSNDGHTPLFSAVLNEKEEVARLLVEAAPAAALIRTLQGAFPLYTACWKGDTAMVRHLLAAVPQAAGMLGGRTRQLSPLQAAVERGRLDIAQLILAAWPRAASVLSVEDEPTTPLHTAICRSDLDMVRLILEAAPEAALVRSSDDSLPLHLVAAMSTELPCGSAMAQLLLTAAPAAATATVAVLEGDSALTPLQYAALYGNAAVARVLVCAAPEAVSMGSSEHQSTPLETALAGAAEAAEHEMDGWLDYTDPSAYLETARPMLAVVPPELSLPVLLEYELLALPLFPEVALHWPLTAAQWAQVPAPCPGLGRALPAVLQRCETEAALLVARLPAADAARLRAAALALHRAPLPADVARHMLSLFDA